MIFPGLIALPLVVGNCVPQDGPTSFCSPTDGPFWTNGSAMNLHRCGLSFPYFPAGCNEHTCTAEAGCQNCYYAAQKCERDCFRQPYNSLLDNAPREYRSRDGLLEVDLHGVWGGGGGGLVGAAALRPARCSNSQLRSPPARAPRVHASHAAGRVACPRAPPPPRLPRLCAPSSLSLSLSVCLFLSCACVWPTRNSHRWTAARAHALRWGLALRRPAFPSPLPFPRPSPSATPLPTALALGHSPSHGPRPRPVAPCYTYLPLPVTYGTCTDQAVGTVGSWAWCYNGDMPGPTLVIRPGDRLVINLYNDMGPEMAARDWHFNEDGRYNSTNLHVHGLFVSPLPSSDHILIQVGPGMLYTYVYEIPPWHPSGTYW